MSGGGAGPDAQDDRDNAAAPSRTTASSVSAPAPGTAFLHDPLFLDHRTGWRHPEQPQRLKAILQRLQASPVWARLRQLAPRDATREEIAAVHATAYIDELAARCAAGGMFEVDADTVASPGTYAAACRAAGAVLTAIDAVLDGRVGNAFCAVRPPGHHAERDRAMGFCFFNNVAIGAAHARRRGLGRVAIVDWDVHHGNGTQHAFEADPTVLYISLHQFPLYPNSGRRHENGIGAGEGFTVNLPLAAGATDTDYTRVFREDVQPAIARFRPELILISAGFDAHRDDPLAGMQLTEEGFAEMTRALCAMAAEHARGRLVSVLEGGYNLDALAASVAAHLEVLTEAAGGGA